MRGWSVERGCPSVTLTEHAVMARTGSGSNRVRACVPGTAHHDPFAFHFSLSERPLIEPVSGECARAESG